MALISPKKVVYLPAKMEEKSNKKIVINYWLITGWYSFKFTNTTIKHY